MTATDEGRAMLENIHDIAPGANLAFATADDQRVWLSPTTSRPCQTARPNIIVDDVGYADEPLFQDGLISQAINTVVARGRDLLQRRGQRRARQRLSVQFPCRHRYRSPGIGTGTFMNFNPSGGTQHRCCPITTGIANAEITFRIRPAIRRLQQPAGSTGVGDVKRQYLRHQCRDRRGRRRGRPEPEQRRDPGAVAVHHDPRRGQLFHRDPGRLRAEPGPRRIRRRQRHNVSRERQPRNSAVPAGRPIPASFGHATGGEHDRRRRDSLVGARALPGAEPAGQRAIQLDRPGAQRLQSPMASPLAAPVTVENPTITAPDGGNTSFFAPGQIINTANPPFPGEPATGTNLSQNLPSFFGTSSAAPNAAAVAALMLQEVPTLTPAQIRQGLIDGATPMNGTPAGTWNRSPASASSTPSTRSTPSTSCASSPPARPTGRPSPSPPAPSR